MAHENKVGIGRITISSRERMVLVEPRGAGLVMSTLRSADEVRAAEFPETRGDIDTKMVGIAEDDHQAQGRHVRPDDLPRPLPRRLARAGRSQGQGAAV